MTSPRPNHNNPAPHPPASGAKSAGDAAFGPLGNTECLERFTHSFETSARRWELVVYPALFAFIVLAAYGFFLIYNLTQDVSSLARSVDRMTVSVTAMSGSMDRVSNRMQAVSLNMDAISTKMDNLDVISATMRSMDRSTQVMSVATHSLNHHVTGINHSVAGMNQGVRPMRAMANFIPW